MQTEYAASRPAKSNSSIWGLLFLAWMMSDGVDKSKADTQALRAEVASLRQSMSADELQYAQQVSLQEGWSLPEDDTTDVVESTAYHPWAESLPQAESEATPAPATSMQRIAEPLHEFLGTDDPVMAMFKMAWAMAPFMFLVITATFLRKVLRG